MKNPCQCCILVCVLVAVLLVFFLKFVLLITRYGITASSVECEQNADDKNKTTAVLTAKVSHEYIFTVIVYAILSVLRILEYVLLGKEFHSFLFLQKKLNDPSDLFKKHSKRFCYLLVFLIILLPYSLLGFAIPGLGIYQEIEHTERLSGCYRHYHEIYITYCVINFLRYMLAFTVRILMIYTTLYLDKLWFPEAEPPKHTSVAQLDSSTHCQIAAKINTKPESRESAQCNLPINETADLCQCTTGTCNSGLFQEVLKDWKAVSTDFQKRVQKYVEIGEKAQVIQELFQTWFVVPWVIYLVASSLKTYNILRPWNADGDGDTPPSDIPSIYYLLYNINQLITLIIPFLCAKKINTYHQKYFKLMRNNQLQLFEDSPSRLSFAHQLVVERNSRYDFEPRIVGTSITISVGSPLFVILLLVGIFLSVSESLL